jgi:hypothetical protein
LRQTKDNPEDFKMSKLVIRTALIAGAALAVSACNRHPTVNNIATNDLSVNMTMSAPANDASAIESVTNTTTTTTTTNTTSNASRDAGAGVSTNNVESNTVGM